MTAPISPATAAPRVCWSCNGPVDADALFCGTCRVVQPPRPIDHFARLGLAPHFMLDRAELDRRYFTRQRQVHPDRFANRTARERAISQNQAVTLNEAYDVLRSPLTRAEYLLRLAGAPVDAAQTLHDPELLVEQMARRESLDEARDVAGVETCIGAAVADAMTAESDIAAAFEARDQVAARRSTLRLRYLQRLVDEARARHARILTQG